MRASRFHRDESRVSGVDAFRASPLRSFPDPDRPPPIRHTRLKVSSTQRYAHIEPCFADVYVFTPGWGRAHPRTGVRGSRRAAPVAGREVGLRERTGPGSVYRAVPLHG